MTIPSAVLSELILKAHQGPFEPEPWRGFLASLRKAVGASYANIVFRSAGPVGGLVEFVDADGDTDAVRGLYAALGQKGDPLSYFSMEPGRWYDASDLLSTDEIQLNDFYRSFLEPARMAWLRVLHVEEPSGYEAWVTITQRQASSDFTKGDLALLDAVAPHVALSLRSFAAIETSQIRDEVAVRITAALGFGCVLIDGEGRVASIDSRAQSILTELSPLPPRLGDRLRLNSPREETLLRHAIVALLGGDVSSETLVIGDEPIHALLVPLRTALVPRAGAPAAALYLARRCARDISHERTEALRELFGLTKREADLAALLASGATLANAAQQMHIAEQTARFYSKKIYNKTNTLGQGDLIRTVLTSVAMLI